MNIAAVLLDATGGRSPSQSTASPCTGQPRTLVISSVRAVPLDDGTQERRVRPQEIGRVGSSDRAETARVGLAWLGLGDSDSLPKNVWR